MNAKRITVVFVASLFAIGLLSACNLASRAADQANQVDAATSTPSVTATTLPAANVKPTARSARPTPVPSINKMNAAKPTATSAPTARQPTVASSQPPTPTVASAKSSSKKQVDDLEQQINQLLTDVDNTDTVDDAGQ